MGLLCVDIVVTVRRSLVFLNQITITKGKILVVTININPKRVKHQQQKQQPQKQQQKQQQQQQQQQQKKRRYRRTPLPLKTLKDCEEFVLTIIARYIEAPTCHQYRGYQNDKVTPFIDSLYLEDLEHAWAKDILNGNQEGEEEELENIDEMLMILGSQHSEDHINLSDQKQKYFKFPSRTKMNTRGFRLKAEGSITTQKINANSNPGKSIYIYCVFSLLNIDSV